MKVILGVIALTMGTAILGWIGYDLSIQGQRGFTVALLPGVATASAMLYCGAIWVRGNPADDSPAKE